MYWRKHSRLVAELTEINAKGECKQSPRLELQKTVKEGAQHIIKSKKSSKKM
jgi:hypothetical protein